MSTPTPGIYPGITRAEYDAIPAANQTALKRFRRTPAHARYAMDNPTESTAAQKLGTLVHCYLLEPDRVGERYAVLPDLTDGLVDDSGNRYANPKATKKYKALRAEFEAKHAGKHFIDPADLEVCRGISEAVCESETASRQIGGDGEHEVGVIWQDPDTGLYCKGLIDVLRTNSDGLTFAADLKTTTDAGPAAFARDCAQHAYHVQGPFYLWGLKQLGRPAHKFLHVVCETAPPYAVAVYELDDESLDQGWREVRTYLDQYAQCLKTGRWPAYPDTIETLRLPRWRFTDEGLGS